MAALRFCRLPASSLLEVIVASVILVLVFGLALGSLARLSVSGPSQLALRGRQLVGRAAAETIRQHAWQAHTWREGPIEMQQEVRTFPDAPHLVNLRITATVRGSEIAHLQQLIYAPPTATP